MINNIFELRLNGSPRYIEVARMSVGVLASALGFDMEKVEEIEMAVGESCRLLVCHHNQYWSAEYMISCRFADDVLVIDMKDTNIGIIEKNGERCCIDCPNEGEVGAHMIESLMDGCQFIDQKNGRPQIILSKER